MVNSPDPNNQTAAGTGTAVIEMPTPPSFFWIAACSPRLAVSAVKSLSIINVTSVSLSQPTVSDRLIAELVVQSVVAFCTVKGPAVKASLSVKALVLLSTSNIPVAETDAPAPLRK